MEWMLFLRYPALKLPVCGVRKGIALTNHRLRPPRRRRSPNRNLRRRLLGRIRKTDPA